MDRLLTLLQDLPGELLPEYSLKKLNTWKVGGAAELAYKPQSVAELATALSRVPEASPVNFIGLGSNVLVPDSGLPGLTILTQNHLTGLELLPTNQVYVETGVACAKFAKFCAKNALAGAGWFAGIPGTIGGALKMNAGAFGGETWSHVEQVTVVDRQGRLTDLAKDKFKIYYRHVELPFDAWFVSAIMQLDSGDVEAELATIREMLNKRNTSQPIGLFSCGSVFKNPPNDHAARLIQACGLKGTQVGQAQISEKHANFIINLGGASSADILALINLAKAKVQEQFDISLEPEVRILNER